MTYVLDIPGLAATIAGAPVAPKHAGLMAARHRHAQLSHARLSTNRGDTWLSHGKVLAADGARVHGHHEAWRQIECASE